MWSSSGQHTTGTPPNEESVPLAENTPLTGYEPKLPDDFHYSETTSPLSRGTLKSKGGGKLSLHFCTDGGTIETVFRTIISFNQLSLYGAVAEMCDEYRICQARTGRPVLAEQSDPLFEPASVC